ncbi:MAG: tRNA (adenosine(37)-N6)-dimethylallyltransferase MiaA [Candidatus Omnitrophica bacterium]|nr:tRNA (adenosine(37)-N6)-dimethylallyltransferase MiaA [Candidatus Omnitrophota bacterium]
MSRLVFIVGPTATGKTDVAYNISKRSGADIVSCDSMLVYREPCIVTAKPDKEILSEVKHHFIDIISVTQEYNVFDYYLSATQKIKEFLSRGKSVIVCGGTGLYMKALLDGLADTPAKDDELRKQLTERARFEGLDVLYEELEKIDSVYAQKISHNDLKRIVRALEVYKLTGKTISEFKPDANNGLWGKYDIDIFAVEYTRDELYDRINKRVDVMFEKGVVDEVKEILKFELSVSAKKIIGIPEIKEYIDWRITFNDCKELMKKNTRNYAKRQLTWFRADKRIKWVENADEVLSRVKV